MIPLDEVVHFDVITRGSSGVSDADSTPTFDVYEEATDTGLLGATNFTKRTSLTGNYRGTFTASAANGFEVGKWYNVIATATVGGTTDKTVAMTFRLAAAETAAGVPKVDVSHLLGTAWLTPGTAGTPDVNVKLWNGLTTVALPLVPTTAGRTLDVSATGEAGVDWANVGGQGTSVNLSATTINLVNTATTVTNQLTAAAIATGVWQDSTAGDFTVASSIGKALYINNVVPGAAGGHFIAGSNAATTVNITGTITTVTNLTNLPSIPANWLTAAGTAADFWTEIGTAVWANATRTLTSATNITDTGGTITVTSGGVHLADGAHGGSTAVLTLHHVIISNTDSQTGLLINTPGAATLAMVGDQCIIGQASAGDAVSFISTAGSGAVFQGAGVGSFGVDAKGEIGIRVQGVGSPGIAVYGLGSVPVYLIASGGNFAGMEIWANGNKPGLAVYGGVTGGGSDSHGIEFSAGHVLADDVFLEHSRSSTLGAAIGASVIGNGRTRDYFLQGGTNKIAFDVPAPGQFTIYATDDTTVLKTGTYTSAAGNPVTIVDPT